MRIGILGREPSSPGRSLEDVIAEIVAADADGFASFWAPQVFGFDMLTVLALAAARAPRIELGTGVVITQGRHPFVLASQALTTQAASNGRFTLGVGLSHRPVIERMYRLSFDRPVRQLREMLQALDPLLRGGSVDVDGEFVSAAGAMSTPALPRIPVLVGALGEQTLRVAGRWADGTMTWMTGPATLAGHTVPTISAAAAEAGRSAPRVVVTLPVCITDDPSSVRARLAADLGFYHKLPSYRAMIEREGASGPADLAIIGDEAALKSRLDQLAAAGATDFGAMEVGVTDADRLRTREALRALL